MRKKVNYYIKIVLASLMLLSGLPIETLSIVKAEDNGEELSVEVADEKLVSEVTENITEEKTVETTEDEVTEANQDLSVLDGADFSSGRLLVTEEAITEEAPVIGTLNGVALLQYETEEEAKVAYLELTETSNVEVDINSFGVAEETEVAQTPVEESMTVETNPFTEVEQTTIDSVVYDIAVIDTGATDADSILSVLGDDGIDYHGHGQNVINTIKGINPSAKVLSIKALDNSGVGSTSAVYAAIRLAIDNQVKIINLSISATKIEENSIIEDIINEAVAKGIKVVGAAGNNNMDASGFIPGGVGSAIIMGASDDEGNKQEASNFGDTVDYYMPAESTSIASAKASAYLGMGKDLAEAIKEEASANNQAKPTTPNENGEFEPEDGGGGGGNIGSGTIGGSTTDSAGAVWRWFDSKDNVENHQYLDNDLSNTAKLTADMNDWINRLTQYVRANKKNNSLTYGGSGYDRDWVEKRDKFINAMQKALRNALNRRSDVDRENNVGARIVGVGVTYQVSSSDSKWYIAPPFVGRTLGYKDVVQQKGRNNELPENFVAFEENRNWSAEVDTSRYNEAKEGEKWRDYSHRIASRDNANVTFDGNYDYGIYIIAVLGSEPSDGTPPPTLHIEKYGKYGPLAKTNIVVYKDLDNDGFPDTAPTNEVVYQGWTTGEEIVVELDPDNPLHKGKLSVREHMASPGYVKDTREHYVTITDEDFEEGREVYFHIEDYPIHFRKAFSGFKEGEEITEAEKSQFEFVVYAGDVSDNVPTTSSAAYNRVCSSHENTQPSGCYVDKWTGTGDHAIGSLGDDVSIEDYGWTAESYPAARLIDGMTYTIVETKAPDRVKKMEPIVFIAKNADDLIVSGGEWVWNDDRQIRMIRGINKPAEIPVNIKKVDTNGNNVPNVELTLWQDKNSNGTYEASTEKIQSWSTSNTAVLNTKLLKGTYIVSETKVPAGYVKAKDKTFTITGDETGTVNVEIENFQIKAQKIDGSGTAVKGATLAVYPANSNTAVDTWTDSQNEHVIKGLVEGEKYVLKETVTPAGYVKANDIPFTADNGTSTQVIKMTDLRIPVIKHDDKGQALAGVVLQVLEGNTVKDEWTTTKNEHYVSNLEIGKTYTLHEKSAPEEWELADDKTFKADKNQSLTVLTMTDEHKTNAMVKKTDADLDTIQQGDATLVGTVFTLTDTTTNKEVGKMTVGNSGNTNVLKNLTNKHNYKVVETTVMEGYKKANDITITGTQLKNGRDESYLYTFNVEDSIIRGSFKVRKNDADLDTNYAQGDVANLKTTFELYNKSKYPVYVNGKSYAVNEKIMEFTTDNNGEYTAPAKLLPYGTYLLKEKTHPTNYTNRGTTETTFSIRTEGEVKDLTSVIENEVARLTLKIQKRDNLTGSNKPMGSATLEGAVFEVYNKSAKDITYNGKRIKVGELVDTITTDKNGVATLGNLPYGTYLVKEIKAPRGYVLKGHLESTVVLHGEDGSEVFAQEYRGKNGTNSTNKSIDNDPIRGDFELRKISSDPQGRMSNIQFKVTSRTTGESAIFMTDENGEFRSISTWNSHKENTNKGETELDGIWFGQYVDDNGDTQTLEPDDELGAMPYDTYDIEELPGPNNEGYTMWKDSFTVSRDKVVVQLNNIENTKLEIGTKATSLNNDKVVPAVEDTIIIDTVEVKGAKNLIGEKAMLVGTLMDKETGEALTIDGATAQIIFDVKKADFEKEIEFTVDGTKLQGKNIVVFEKLYKVTVDKDGNVLTEEEVGNHEDIDDEDQLVTISEARTTLKDQATDTHVVEYREEVTLVDTVVYKGLKKGRTYEVEGILMDKETGKPFLDADGKEVTATTKYKAPASDGEVELTFTFKGIKKGMKIVAFETVYYKGEEYIVHADLNDEDQTVYVPEIKTRANGVNDTQFIVEGEDATIVDTIDYKAFVPGETYVLKGTLYDKTEGKLTDITAESEPFVAETSEGSVEVTFNFDATGLGNHIMVVYEKAFMLEKPEKPEGKPTVPEKPIATHEDPEDEDQTIFVEEPEDEKYVNKVVHEELGSFKDTFTYDIMGYVTHDADAIEFSDELVEALEFVSTAEDVKVYVHETNDHKPNGTVASAGTLLESKEVEIETEGEEPTKATTPVVKIEGQKLTVEILNAEEYRGKWLRVEFDAKIKDAYKSLEALKTLKVTDNGNVLTEEVHTGVPNKAEMIIKVNNVGKHKIKTNPVTVIPPTPEIKTTLVAENLKTVYRGQVYEMTDTVEYKNLEVGETYRMEGRLVNAKGEKLPVETASLTFKPETRDGSVELTFTVDTAVIESEYVVAFEKLYVVGDVDKDTEPTDDNPTPKKDTEVAKHEDPKDPSQTVTIIEPNEPRVEKYINKAVHKDVTLDEVFTYDIVAFVPENADEIELTDVLNDDLQFVSKASEITLVDLGTDNNHKVENNISNNKVNDDATVSLKGTKVDAEAKISKQTLTINANAKSLRGHWVKATFTAKIKDGKKVEDLKYSEIIDNNPVITDESHSGVPNIASLRVKVRNNWSKKVNTNIVTVNPIKIRTVAKFDNGAKSISAGQSNKVVDTIIYTGLTPGKKYVTYAQMMDKNTNKPVSEKVRMEFTTLVRNGEVKVEIPLATKDLRGSYVAYEELYELNNKDGKQIEVYVTEHKDINDADQTVTVIEPDTPDTANDNLTLPYIIGFVFSLTTLFLYLFSNRKTKVVK